MYYLVIIQVYTQNNNVIPVYYLVIIQVYTQNNNVIHQFYTCVHTSVFLENTTVGREPGDTVC